MAYKFDDIDCEDMDDLALSERLEREDIESNKNKSDDYSMDTLDIYDSYYG